MSVDERKQIPKDIDKINAHPTQGLLAQIVMRRFHSKDAPPELTVGERLKVTDRVSKVADAR